MARTTHRYLHIRLTIELVFDAACIQSRSLVRVVRKNITYVILSRTTLTNEGEHGKQYGKYQLPLDQ